MRASGYHPHRRKSTMRGVLAGGPIPIYLSHWTQLDWEKSPWWWYHDHLQTPKPFWMWTGGSPGSSSVSPNKSGGRLLKCRYPCFLARVIYNKGCGNGDETRLTKIEGGGISPINHHHYHYLRRCQRINLMIKSLQGCLWGGSARLSEDEEKDKGRGWRKSGTSKRRRGECIVRRSEMSEARPK